LVYAQGTGNNTVTLTNVTATGSGSNVFATAITLSTNATTILNINQSNLKGDLSPSGSTLNAVNLAQGSTLTGKSTRGNFSILVVNIDSTSQWNVNGTSSVNVLELEVGATLNLGSNAFAVADRLTLELAGPNLSGQIIGGDFTLGTSVLLNFGAGFYVEGLHSYDIFSGTDITGDFLSSLNWGNLDLGQWLVIENISFVDGTLSFNIIDTIPEPGTWALMLGGVGVLGYLQRVRRNRK